jgi:hypothetical protein
MRHLAAVLVLGVGLGWAVPASADRSQAGCREYGAFLASNAQGVGLGGVVSGVATSGPGAVADTSLFLRQLTCS